MSSVLCAAWKTETKRTGKETFLPRFFQANTRADNILVSHERPRRPKMCLVGPHGFQPIYDPQPTDDLRHRCGISGITKTNQTQKRFFPCVSSDAILANRRHRQAHMTRLKNVLRVELRPIRRSLTSDLAVQPWDFRLLGIGDRENP